jgi:thiol-disulfide isomerase/thioredoxin
LKNFALLLLCLVSVNSYAETFSIDSYKGKVVYLDFWASWCGPCKESLPWLNSIQKKYKDKNLIVIGINLDKDRSKADAFLTNHPADFAVFFNPEGDIAKHYGVKGMPFSVVIDKTGKIVHSHTGFNPEKTKEYISELEGVLK